MLHFIYLNFVLILLYTIKYLIATIFYGVLIEKLSMTVISSHASR